VSAPPKLAAFAAALAVLFAGGALAGRAIGPERGDAAAPTPSPTTDPHQRVRPQEAEMNGSTQETHASPRSTTEPEHPVRGLAVAENGLRVVVDNPELRRGQTETVRIRIVDDRGETVHDFDVSHERRMHLIVVRRDLTGFQHLHPERTADGMWRAPVRLENAGSYRVFADFAHEGEPFTLASDLRVDGPAELRALPAPAPTALSDGGYEVRLAAGRARPGEEAELSFAITKDGATVRTEPYLGAGGHLVALREGDLAFLHVHPTEHGHGTRPAGGHADTIGFAATFPTTGRYRLFLQFQHEGRVQTVAFTQEVR
jgi:hypothetical protein